MILRDGWYEIEGDTIAASEGIDPTGWLDEQLVAAGPEAEVHELNAELAAVRVSFPDAMKRVLTVLVAGFPASRA